MEQRPAPLTHESVENIIMQCNYLRKMITDESLNVSGFTKEVVNSNMTGEMLGVTGKLAKAFDALNHAAQFINTAANHVDYAKKHYDEYTSAERLVPDTDGTSEQL